MKILVVIDSHPESGGVFSYMLSICELIKNSNSSYSFLFMPTTEEAADVLKQNEIAIIPDMYKSNIRSVFCRIVRRVLMIMGGRFVRLSLNKSVINFVIKKYDVDLVYFLGHSPLAIELTKAPFIYTVWDFCHRDWPEFPEVNTDYIFESRENSYTNSINRAIAVVVDSDALAEKTMKYYGVNKERIVKVPFLVTDRNDAESVDIVKKYKLEKPFIFYPAQFWPHKNHYYILEGLKLLKEEQNLVLNVVFTGKDCGNLDYILKSAEKMGIASQIEHIGFIPKDDVLAFYKKAVALVMPTYFGPTNLPPLEALSMNCPVLYSDLPEFRREYDGAVFFMNLDNPQSMAESLVKILNKDPIVELYKEAGKKLLKEHDAKNAWKVLEETFVSFERLLKRWK